MLYYFEVIKEACVYLLCKAFASNLHKIPDIQFID